MKLSIFIREANAFVLPGWRGGPALYACQLLSVILLGRHSRVGLKTASNDNGARHG